MWECLLYYWHVPLILGVYFTGSSHISEVPKHWSQTRKCQIRQRFYWSFGSLWSHWDIIALYALASIGKVGSVSQSAEKLAQMGDEPGDCSQFVHLVENAWQWIHRFQGLSHSNFQRSCTQQHKSLDYLQNHELCKVTDSPLLLLIFLV